MAMIIKKEDNRAAFIAAKDAAVEKALETVGLQAENYAVLLCPVDTGLLRNSITHAVSGKPPSKSVYYADKPKNGEMKSGSYSGTVGGGGEKAVYIGTNVEYAPYQEYGSRRTKAQPFLKPAVEKHGSEYQEIIESCLKNA